MTTNSLHEYGHGPAVVLVASADETPSIWDNQIQALSQTYRVLVATNIRSEEALEAELDKLELDRIALVAHADAANICASVTCKIPNKIAAVVLVAADDINTETLSASKVPSAFIAGLDDEICLPESIRATQEKVEGSFLVEVYKAGHHPFVDCATEFNDSLLSILQMAGHTGSARPAHSNASGYFAPEKV